MSASKSDKPLRIKGLVKRCRSFKEDILSRLARNRSLGSESPGNAPGAASPTGWNNGDLLSGGVSNVEPHVSISHRLKEAHLTLQFVESLIQKNCIDLLGGSSNVMLDLMGCLLNDIKKASASDSASYQSAVSQVKAALSDFLTSVDVLLLKDHHDEGQQELYVEKLLESLKTTREALLRLKNLIDSKENKHGNNKIPPVTSTPKKTQSTPGVNTESMKNLNVLTPSQSNTSPTDPKADWGSEPVVKSEDKRPPLPPKLKQWTAKSFDMIDWSQGPSSPSNAPPSRNSSQLQLSSRGLPFHTHHHNTNSTSLLNQWLEQSSSMSGTRPESPLRHNSGASNSTSQLSPRSSHAHQQPFGLSTVNSSSSGSLLQHQVYQHKEHHHSSKFFELSTTSTPHSQSQNWTDSSIYVGRTSTSSASGSAVTSSVGCGASKILQLNGKKTRTFSDSYRLGSEDSLDKMLLVDESRSQSAATTHSQSLSLGSSLDNLLLVDAQSQQSGLSPNSTSGGAGSGANRVSVSSCNTNSGTGLAGLSTYDPDTDTDADVFLTEVNNSNGARCRQRSRENVGPSAIEEEESPPPTLPEKQTRIRGFLATRNNEYALATSSRDCTQSPRCPSPYDNVKEGEEIDIASWHGTGSLSPGASAYARPSFAAGMLHRPFMSYSESRNTLVGASCGQDEEKPPLPPKKKHSLITAYVELLHNFDSHAYHLQHHHHHHHFHNHQNSFHYHHSESSAHPPLIHQYSHQIPLQSYHGSSNNSTSSRQNDSSPTGLSQTEMKRTAFANSLVAGTPSITTTGTTPLSPDDNYQLADNQLFVAPTTISSLSPSSSSEGRAGLGLTSASKPPALPPKKSRAAFLRTSASEQGEQNPTSLIQRQQSPPNTLNALNIPVVGSSGPSPAPVTPAHSFSGAESVSIGSPQRSLDEENVDIYILDPGPSLVMNDGSTTVGKPSCDGPEVKGGDPHVLIVYAASPNLTDKKFREVFLLTYRNFVRPLDVISLLWKRYQYFEKKTDRSSVVHARATLDLFVDVVNSLTPMDLDDDMVGRVRDCIYYLVSNGEIMSALKARKGLIVKYSVRVKLLCPKPAPVSLAITAEGQTLLQWSATSIAQQMTLLDSELFRQLEPAELLLWAREQTEDLCPALNNFTEHFNKVSYWARSKVLTCVTSRERNRTMKKLIEVMRKLREYSNFNSLLAVLAALDSAPIRRLGFSRRLTEALKPHAALTDSSGSFRTYRLALAESKPPCIPYLGLVLQDLTFVHIGNVDFLADGKVNWIKRWQQWVVLEPIRRFHSCQYGFIRNDSLLSFLNNFDESLNDDDLWQLSEQIKPRSKN